MYHSQITRAHKGAFLILLDQSGSMAEEAPFEGHTTTKAEALCDVLNGLLEEIINHCHREGFVGDYFDIGIIGYSGTEARNLLGKGFVSVTKINTIDTPVKHQILSRTLPSGESFQTIVERRCWIAPVAKGRTPMGEALGMATHMCRSWCKNHPESFPPIVINISDGEATDAPAEEIIRLADKLKACHTNDGNTLLINILLATEGSTRLPHICFPSESEPVATNRHARLLYNISSTLPELFNQEIIDFRGGEAPFRGMCVNASVSELVSLLAIGTLSTDMMV